MSNERKRALKDLKEVMVKHKLSFTIDEGLLIASYDFDIAIDLCYIDADDIGNELDRMK